MATPQPLTGPTYKLFVAAALAAVLWAAPTAAAQSDSASDVDSHVVPKRSGLARSGATSRASGPADPGSRVAATAGDHLAGRWVSAAAPAGAGPAGAGTDARRARPAAFGPRGGTDSSRSGTSR